MKKFLLGAAAAAMALTGFAASASAAPYGFYGHQNQSRQWNQSRDWNQNRQWDRDRQWSRGGERWRTGQYYSGYRDHRRMVDWRAYNLPRPRDGYGYYRDDDGSIVMAALASGIIGLVLGNALAN